MLRTVLAASLLAAFLAAPPATASAQDAVPGEVLVRFKGNAGGSERGQARRAAKVDVKRDLRLSDAQVLRTEPGQTVEEALSALRGHGSVRYAEPNFIVRAAASPDDTHYGYLWGLHNTGQSFLASLGTGTDDADIDAPEAWDLITDASAVKVAVVDSGVRANHPDLAGNMVAGWDFLDGDADPTDLNDHGTHVAGTIAAQGDNAAGVAGVAWDAQIMPLRALGADGYGTYAAIVDAFDYAGDMGAKVVNASLGAEGPGTFYDAVIGAHPGTLFVVAAGNGGEDGVGDDNDRVGHQPCDVPKANVICVAATDHKDQLAGFSNYGTTSVDLAAPGVGTLSTVPEFGDTFKDEFSADLSKWTTAGSTAGAWKITNGIAWDLPDDTGLTYSRNENLILTTAQPVSLAGKKNCVLQYEVRYGYSFNKDRLLVETSTNGTTWVERASFTGENGYFEELRTDLRSDGAPALYVRFRVDADRIAETENDAPKEWFGTGLDDVSVKCESAARGGHTYAFMQGTSMAAPHVAGVATLLFAAKPAATVADVRSWLLTSGDPLPALSGKTVSGRRLNARRSLEAALGLATVDTLPVQGQNSGGAMLRGTVDPNGTPTTYKFVYGAAPDALTSQIPATPAAVGTGNSPTPVTQTVTGLAADTTYFYRLVAIQGTTEHPGAIRSFRTVVPAPPIVVTGGVSSVTSAGATLAALIDANGQETTYRFEYRKAGTSGPVVQTAEAPAGASEAPVTVTTAITGLTPDTEYVYRVIVPGGPQGAERTFRTPAAPVEPVTPAEPVPLAPVSPAGPVDPPTPPATITPRPPAGTITCGLTRTRKVSCRAASNSTARVTVRVTRGGKLYARGSADRLTKGRTIRMRTLRAIPRGRYKVTLTLVRDGVKTTVARTLRF